MVIVFDLDDGIVRDALPDRVGCAFALDHDYIDLRRGILRACRVEPERAAECEGKQVLRKISTYYSDHLKVPVKTRWGIAV
jgi:hypothetical protein